MAGLDDIEDTLTDKVGPFPVWGWGIGLGGVALAFMWFNRGGSDPATDGETVTPDEATAAGLGTDMVSAGQVMDANDSSLWTGNDQGDNSDPAPVVNNNYYSGGATPGNPTGDPHTGITTNALWVAKGTLYLSGQGHSAVASQTLLNNYVSHKPIAAANVHLVDQVIAHQGPPPNWSVGSTTKVTHPTPHGGAGSSVKTKAYVVKHGDTIRSIVNRFWGSASAMHMEAFRKMNGLGSKAKLHVGQHLKVKA